MRVLRPDPSRRIDLPGVGPCPRPVDVDAAATGFSRLTSLRVYRFTDGAVIHGEAEGDEVIVAALDGEVEAVGALTLTLGRPEGRALYLPPGGRYRLAPRGDATVAYARSPAEGRVPARAARPGEAAGERLRHDVLALAPGAALPGAEGERLVHVIAGALRLGDGAALAPGDTLATDAAAPAVAEGRARVLVLSA